MQYLVDLLISARLVLAALLVPPFAWILVAYVVGFWRTRQRKIFGPLFHWCFTCFWTWVLTKSLVTGMGLGGFKSIGGATIYLTAFYLVIGYWRLYRLWFNRETMPGYVRSRDMLLLLPSPPVQAPPSGIDPVLGLYVPSAAAPVDEPLHLGRAFVQTMRILPKAILLGGAIVVVFFAITKILFGFGPFF